MDFYSYVTNYASIIFICTLQCYFLLKVCECVLLFGQACQDNHIVGYHAMYLRADKSLARSGRKQAAPVKSMRGREMDWFG